MRRSANDNRPANSRANFPTRGNGPVNSKKLGQKVEDLIDDVADLFVRVIDLENARGR